MRKYRRLLMKATDDQHSKYRQSRNSLLASSVHQAMPSLGNRVEIGSVLCDKFRSCGRP